MFVRLLRGGAAVSALLLTTGCFGHLTPANADFSSLEVPVLLGPKDRVHAKGQAPLKTRKVTEFEGTTVHAEGRSESSSGGYTTTTHWQRVESDLVKQARSAVTGKGDNIDIRLTEVKPQAYGIWVSTKSRVDIDAEVVAVEVP